MSETEWNLKLNQFEDSSCWRVVDHFLAAMYVIVLNWITWGPCKWNISCRKHVFIFLSSIVGKFTCKLKAISGFISQCFIGTGSFILFLPKTNAPEKTKIFVEMFYSRISTCLKNKIEVVQSLMYLLSIEK